MMNRLEEVLYDPNPKIAVSFTQELLDSDLEKVLAIADVSEFRVDRFPEYEMEYLKKQAGRLATIPILATIRTVAEGGSWLGEESDRRDIFYKLLPLVDGIDVELESELLPEMIAIAHDMGKVVIASTHNFISTPSISDLYDTYWRSIEKGVDFVKFALMVNSREEFQRLVSFTLSHKEDVLITVGMGPFGSISRIVLPVLGSRLTYAHPGDLEVAPGQMDFLETSQLLKRLVPSLGKTN